MKELINKFTKRYGSNPDKWAWKNISDFHILSEDFIREFKDKVDWRFISSSQNLSEEFIREFKDKVYWDFISYNQNLSEDFIREFQDKINWKWLYMSSLCPLNIKAEYIRENVTKEDPFKHSIEEIIEKKDNSLDNLKKLVGI